MDIEDLRKATTRRLDPSRRAELGQFFTPADIAAYMADMFCAASRPARLMEAGAGVGCLIHAAASKMDVSSILAWEIDESLIYDLTQTVASVGVPFQVRNADFIGQLPDLLASDIRFDRVILNPPYRKISVKSPHRKTLEDLGVRTTNLYSAFLVAAMMLMADGGEMVAIVPRSCLNGLYHLDFRDFVLRNASLDRIHVFHSRRAAFSEDAVLQENVILKFTKSGRQAEVTVTTSSDGDFSDVETWQVPFSGIVRKNDPNKFIRLPGNGNIPLGVPLSELGIEVSTGPLVEFKALAHAAEDGAGHPVVSSRHLSSAGYSHPSEKAKINRLVVSAKTDRDLWPIGHYVVVKRISPKEAPRRVLAYHVTPDDIGSDRVAFENRLNVFHSGKAGLPIDVAERLCRHLNSPEVEAEFLSFSGNTQVNATDLRALTYPRSVVSA
jgi:adenine-specific DNA-methyltransferase|nr:Eco57I restriction-modification methylase domain-containing protein [Neorhizobium tomejilense]